MNNEEKIMKLLYENSNKEYHIRLLARLTKLSPNTVSHITNELSKKGLLKKEADKELNTIKIRANSENREFKLRKKFFYIRKIYDSGLIDYFNDFYSYPTIILFGSYAKAENHEKSDIDIFVIADDKKKCDLNIYEKKLNSEIQIFLHTKKEFKELMKKSKELINNVLNGYIMSGFLEVL